MEIFEIPRLIEEPERQREAYVEFLRVPAMSCGLYRLPAKGVDPQGLHTEDEVYYVVRGRARIRVGSEDRDVREGTLVFVPAGMEHRFHDIAEPLTLLVFFAPPEGTRRD